MKGAGWGFGGVYLDIIMIKLEICLKNMKRSPEAFFLNELNEWVTYFTM